MTVKNRGLNKFGEVVYNSISLHYFDIEAKKYGKEILEDINNSIVEEHHVKSIEDLKKQEFDNGIYFQIGEYKTFFSVDRIERWGNNQEIRNVDFHVNFYGELKVVLKKKIINEVLHFEIISAVNAKGKNCLDEIDFREVNYKFRQII